MDSSVKKLFILAIVKGVPETTQNVEQIMSALKMENVEFEFCIATDMKLQNIICGLQSSSSTFPCPYCESPRPFTTEGILRTLGRIKKLYRSFIASGKKLKDAKDFLNVIHMPLITGDDDTEIIELLPIPELHLLLGIGKN